jgi:hypothetical protein
MNQHCTVVHVAQIDQLYVPHVVRGRSKIFAVEHLGLEQSLSVHQPEM